MQDAKRKGRKAHREETKILLAQYRGDKHKGCKLTDAQVEDIRKEYAAGGVTQQELAIKYGVFNTTICKLVKHRSRGTKPPIERKGNAVLYENQVLLIRRLYSTGDYSYMDLSFLLKIPFNTIALVARGDTWKYVQEPDADLYPGIV